MNDTSKTLRGLAASMQPVVEAIGYDLSVALVTRFGGTTISLRRSPPPDDPVALVIGPQARNALVDRLGCGQFEVPKCTAWLIARRDEEIRLRADAGELQADLARRFHLTERHIRRICNEHDPLPEEANP